ncbi:olfactory receptor 4D2-like [Heteronotia binoei]|uniref:olfactory receptor 4D2-like n=1 Tax=Heteronotia binoei TaxID=13085 RepID=UPI00292EBADA|nr:olfactory receptor 4D2-like [Heteronotia binoei]
MANNTTVTEFILLGLSQNPRVQSILFLIFLAIYITSWLGNLTIITIVIFKPQLHTPMYFFLANLAVMDISDSTVTSIKMLWDLITHTNTISYNWCIAQVFFFHFIGGALTFFLVVMAVERYIAIYKPLQYLLIMHQGVCVGLVTGAWLGGFAHSIVQVALILQLHFCGPNILDHFFCDISQIVKLSCTDTYMTEILFVLLVIKIKTHMLEGRHKALSTCAAQIIVISIYFGPSMFTYNQLFKVFPGEKFVAVMYSLITPVMNPIIYTLRNAEMKNAIRKLKRKIWSPRRISYSSCCSNFSSEFLKCRRCI